MASGLISANCSASTASGHGGVQRKLYVTGFYQPALFRYEGRTNWTSLGSPDGLRPGRCASTTGRCTPPDTMKEPSIGSTVRDGAAPGTLGDATQIYGLVIHNGKLHAGSWPKGTVYRFEGDDQWTSTGRLGAEEEVMGPAVYNGKLYAGTLPLAEIFRYDGDDKWQSVGRVDTTPDVMYRRAWNMAVFKGRLFSGTLPSGHLKSFEAGKNVTYDHPLKPGWRHIAAVRGRNRLKLYDGVITTDQVKRLASNP